MYATRVLSVLFNHDFIDQSQHSIGKFYSGSHPPLLIWLGWISSMILGINPPALKIIPFICALFSLFLIYKIGKEIHSPLTGILGAMMFSSNIIFAVFSKRFQFDFPYTFLILLGIFFFIIYEKSGKRKYVYLIGITLGICLMIKILVGFLLPMVIGAAYIFLHKKLKIKLFDIILLTSVGILIAAPWHIYMISKYGGEFLKWFLGYHIYDRAFLGLERNYKNSGYLYHINYLLSILPFSIIIFFSLFSDFKKIKNIELNKMIIWIWFIIGFIIITVFKTKLEVYILLVLAQVCIMIPIYLDKFHETGKTEKLISIVAVFFNIFWVITFAKRDAMKIYLSDMSNLPFSILIITFSIAVAAFVGYLIIRFLNLKFLYYTFIFAFFISLNIYQMVNIPWWENSFDLTSIKKEIDKSGNNEIIYVSANFRANPQFSYYFRGLDIGWENGNYKYELLLTRLPNKLDTLFKDYNYHQFIKRRGSDNVKQYLDSIKFKNAFVIVERDEINRTDYDSTNLFIPDSYKQIMKVPGYELFR